MTSREIVWRTIRFEGAPRLAYDFPPKFGTDFAETNMVPSPDGRPRDGYDEWGALWKNLGATNLGEVKECPLKDWNDWDKLVIPDIRDERRWAKAKTARAESPEKFLLGYGVSLYERLHFIRGMENAWTDIYDEPERMGRLLDILVDMNLYAVQRYSQAGVDGLFWTDDWGLQNRLMISPEKWREVWKPRYAKVYQASHQTGMSNWLHSCGYIVDILDDLIEIGLDAVHMDQQENMGLELLGKRFGGRLTFYSPVDIQTAMQKSVPEVRAYCREMVKHLHRPLGGFIPRWYADPVGAGHAPGALDAMCEEFLKISKELHGA